MDEAEQGFKEFFRTRTIDEKPISQAQIDAIWDEAQRTMQSCLMCKGSVNYFGIFVPFKPGNFGAPPNKDRIVPYGLCEKCFDNCSPEQIEDELEIQILRQCN